LGKGGEGDLLGFQHSMKKDELKVILVPTKNTRAGNVILTSRKVGRDKMGGKIWPGKRDWGGGYTRPSAGRNNY